MRPTANYCWAGRPSLSLIAAICRPSQKGESHLSPSLSLSGFAVKVVQQGGASVEKCFDKSGILAKKKCLIQRKNELPITLAVLVEEAWSVFTSPPASNVLW